MQETVYCDVLFLIDFSIDFLALYICGKISLKRMSSIRLSLASAIGAVFSVLILALSFHRIINLLLGLLICTLMCRIAFGKINVLKNSLLYILINFAISGGITALFSIINSYKYKYDIVIYGNAETVYKSIPVPWLLCFAVVSGIISMILGLTIKKETSKKAVDIVLDFGNGKGTYKGLVDSGNLLCEPISGTPCIVAKSEKLKGIIPGKLLELFNSDNQIDCFREYSGIRMIPMRSVGKSGILYAIRPKILEIDGEAKNAYVAFEKDNGNYGGCELLVPTALL